jgi:hypothetical protein
MQLTLLLAALLAVSTSVTAIPPKSPQDFFPLPPGALSYNETINFCQSITPTSRWEKHICTAVAGHLQQGCTPQRRFAYNLDPKKPLPADKKVKGVVILYHGFTAW